jgi:tRNA/tmRNA/rRNA uracil-C5-methylase (TrmA/RlmC/RlmD family)
MAQGKNESSSAFFQRTRPSFVDWEPPTEAEKARELKARRDAKEAELKRVTDLVKDREAQKKAATKKR